MKNWTPQQRSAIDAHGGTLLVSAAAGSGKTAVLVERVIQKLTSDDPDVYCDADRLLIVTFTRAAAAEMKERIAAALQALVEENPWDSRLRRQMMLLKKAQISTIHAFCSALLRDYFYRLNISPDFRIADAAELKILREECVTDALEKHYAAGDPDFLALAEQVIGDRNDAALAALVVRMEDFCGSCPFPEDFLTWLEGAYDAEAPERTVWAQAAFDDVLRAVRYAEGCNRIACDIAASDEKMNEKYLPAFEQDAETLEAIRTAAERADWDALYRAVSGADVAPLGRATKLPPEAAIAKAARAEVKAVMGSLRTAVISDRELFGREIAFTGRMVRKLAEVLRDYLALLQAAKERRRVLDFSDLEHLSVRLLLEKRPDAGNSAAKGFGADRDYGEDYRKTDAALAVTERYDEIMLDEYQDTNAVQNLIFSAIARNPADTDPRALTDGTNLFMVGDMKQSIYRFRKAVPELFLDKFHRFTPFRAEAPHYPALITLGANFRSRREVTDCVNFLFRALMSEEMGGVTYDETQALAAGAQYPDGEDMTPELHFLSRPTGHPLTGAQYEARFIAETIQRMMAEGFRVTDRTTGELRPARYGDFCILRRSMSGKEEDYAAALAAKGIPVWVAGDGGLLQTDEANVMLSFLRVIGNPLLDIPLLCVMMSPIFAFTPDEMAAIRAGEKHAPLYGAVMTAAKAGSEKCQAFLERMEAFRLLAATLSTDRLMEEICYTTGYLAAVRSLPNGEIRAAGLRLLCEFAADCERSGSYGVGAFISAVDKMLEQGEDLPGASAVTESADVVRIMTIHKSKGLEFPICIVAGLGSDFNRDGDVGGVVTHGELGLGMKMKEDGLSYDTQLRRAMIGRAYVESLSEEMRVLYVALTRAREKLMLIATPRSVDSCLNAAALAVCGGEIPPYALVRGGSFAAWLMAAVLRHPDAGLLRERLSVPVDVLPEESRLRIRLHEEEDAPAEDTPDAAEDVPAPPEEEPAAQKDDAETEAFIAAIEERLQYVYPYEEAVPVPNKVTASELTKQEHSGDTIDLLRPSFLMAGGLTPTERGKALHRYMEFANFRAAAESPEAELERLVARGFLTETEAAAVDAARVRAFFEQMSPMLADAKEILREREFSVLLEGEEARLATGGDAPREPIVLEGECDCVLVYEDGAVILDYKTDRIADSARLAAHYATQLRLYRYAMERVLELPVKGIYLYSFYLNQLIEC